MRQCDRHGCEEPGDRPAPKSPNSPERWYFCERHAAEYNRNWNYFEGLSAEEAAKREANERQDADAFARPTIMAGAAPATAAAAATRCARSTCSSSTVDADFEEIKAAYRRLAKANHPDVKPGDEEAATRFQMIQASYDVLRRAEEAARRPFALTASQPR